MRYEKDFQKVAGNPFLLKFYKFEYPISEISTALAALRPSSIAHTTKDWPRCMSPAVKTPGTDVSYCSSFVATLLRGVKSTLKASVTYFWLPRNPAAINTSCASMIVSLGISPMTPPEVFVELWPKIQKIYPEMKFKLITFENTPENAREILANMGKNIDVIAGIFDETMLELRGCDGTEISREPFCVAVSIHHRLAKKEKITLDDLAGENLMLMRRGWSYYGDMLRDDMMKNHPEINIVDFNLYNVEAFNRCENNNEVLLAFKSWESVHPLIRIIPVEWDYTMPFGILHSKKPSIKVKRLINAINKVK